MSLSVGSVSVDIVPNATGFDAKLKAAIRSATIQVQAVLDASGVRDQIAAISRDATVTVTASVDDAAAKAKLDELSRARDATVNVNLDSGAAAARMDEIARSRDATINVNADTGGAEAQLAAVGANADRSAGSVGALASAALALGPAIIPVAAAAAAALAGIGVGALGSVAGIGVLAAAIAPVIKAVTDQRAAEQGAAAASTASAAAHVAAAARISAAQDSLKTAEIGLANARANGASAAVRAAQAVVNAQRGVRSAAQSTAQAVANAQIGVRTASQAASQAVASAVAQEATAERGLRTALEQEKLAQDALSVARRQAKLDIEALTLSVEDGRLAQRQAALDVRSAKAALDQLGPSQVQIARATQAAANAAARYQIIMANPRATALQKQSAIAADQAARANLANLRAQAGGTQLQREQAQLTYDQAVQHAKDLAFQQRNLADQQRAAVKAGINGAAGVVQAQRGVAQAHQGVADAQARVAAAQRAIEQARVTGAQRVAAAEKAVDQARVSGAARVAAAEQSLASARQAQADQARQTTFSIAAAQDRILASEKALAAARQSDATKATAAASKAAQSMAALSGPGRELASLIVNRIVPGFEALGRSAQAPIARGIIVGLSAMRPLLPVVRELFRSLGGVLGGLAAQVGRALGSPFWVSFFRLIASTAGPALRTFATIVGNLATGLAGIVTTFAPVGAAIGAVLVRLSRQFADFGTGRTGGLQRFFDYVQRIGPLVASTLGALMVAAGHLIVALAPLGTYALIGLRGFARAISSIPIPLLTHIAEGVLAVVLALKGLSIVASIVGAVGTAIEFLASGPVGLVVGALALLAAGVYLVYTHSATFRAFISEHLVPALRAAGQFIRREIVPAFGLIWDALVRLGGVVGPIVAQIFGTFIDVGRRNMPTIRRTFTDVKDIIVGVITLVAAIISRITSIIAYVWRRWGTQITAVIRTVFPFVLKFIQSNLDRIAGIIQLITAIIQGNWGGAWRAIQRIARSYLDSVRAIVGGAFAILRGLFNAYVNWVRSLWSAFWDRLYRNTASAALSIRRGIDNGLNAVKTAFSRAVDAIHTIWSRIQNIAKLPVRFIVQTVLENGLLAAFRTISGVVGFGPGMNLHVGLPRGFAGGGWTGPGSKYQPAGIVHADEYVINRESRRKIEREAPGYLDELNSYAAGGRVRWKGGEFSQLFASRLQQAQRLANVTFQIFQGGFRPPTAASGTSHAGDAVDLGPVLALVVRALRQVGIAAWRRGPAQGFSLRHIHGVPTPGNGFAGGSGLWQAQDYLRGGDGLGGRDYEARVAALSGGALGNINGVDTGGFFSKVGGALGRLAALGNTPFVKMIEGIPRKIASALGSKVTDLARQFVIGTANPQAGFGTTGTNRERGRSLMRQYGFPDSQWPFLDKLWTRESGWNELAQNPSSGAYGIPQALPGIKMATVGADWRANPNTQIMWGLKYIKSVYGDPAGAWAHETRAGWYDKGGWLQPGTTIVHNTSGRAEPVFTGSQFDRLVASRGSGPVINQNFPPAANPMAVAAAAGGRVVSSLQARGFG